MNNVTWEPVDASSGEAPVLKMLHAKVVNENDRDARGFMHRLASIWVGRRGHDYLVLQCEREIDKHRILASCASSPTAYLLRGQLEALQRLAADEGENREAARNIAEAAGVLLPERDG